MSRLHTKVERWERMQEITEQAHDAMCALLKPVTKALGYNSFGGVTRISRAFGGRGIEVTYVDHRSGGPYEHDVLIPLQVWDAEDPVSAAHSFKEAQNSKAAAAERQRKIEQIQQLTEELARGEDHG